MELILASKSPRRQQILRDLGIPYKVFCADVDETVTEPLTPCETVKTLSLRKLRAAASELSADGEGEDRILLCADTVVAVDHEIYGKPRDYDDAFRMLRSMSGRAHSVFTGYSVMRGDRVITDATETRVYFRTLTDAEIAFYLETEPPYDKAGAYGIQELAGLFVERIEGDYLNIVGLPISDIVHACKTKLGTDLTALITK